MSTITRAAATATLLALSLGLTACGGSSDSATSSSTSSASASSSSTSTTSSSTPVAPPSTSSVAPSSSSSSTSEADDDKKPTKAAAAAGLDKAFQSTEQGKTMNPVLVTKVTACIVDKTHDKLSAKTLNAFVSADGDAQLEAKDNATYLDAAKKCGQEIGASQ